MLKTSITILPLLYFAFLNQAIASDIENIKTSANTSTNAAVSKLGKGSAFGQVNGNYVKCDDEGNCIDTGTMSLNMEELAGKNDNKLSGSPTEGLNNTYTSTISIEISCKRHGTYTLASGVMIKIANCATDHDKNVYELSASRCNKLYTEEGCYESPDDWSPAKTFSKTSAPYINNQTIQLASDVTAKISCRPRSYTCDLTAQVRTELIGTTKELGEQANATNTSDDNALSGNQISRKISNDPTYQDYNEGMAADYTDCVKNTTFDTASDGYLLSCDGANRADITVQCTEIATCIQEQDTIITSVAKCDAYVPLAYQTCRVEIPSGACEVFLETTQQTCDNITPNGECVKELENAIKICETFTPHGTCNNELVVSQPACVFSVPEGSCNMEKVLSTTTCTNTVNKGECNRELETFVKTCDVDVEETKDCVVTIDVTESDCNANANYTLQACKSTKAVSEHSCGIKYTLVNDSKPAKCMFKDGHRVELDWNSYPPQNGEYRIHYCNDENTYEIRQYLGAGITDSIWVEDIKTKYEQAKKGKIQISLKYRHTLVMLPPYAFMECDSTGCDILNFWTYERTVMARLPFSKDEISIKVLKNDTCKSSGLN